MAQEKTPTIFSRLNRVLGSEQPNVKFRINPMAFKDASEEEIDQKRLETQQSLYLQNQWRKIDNELYSKAVYYEPTRISAYYDFESMEYTPEISAALDIFAEEATTAGENGKVLQIFSESQRIKQELENLFENILDIDTNLPAWARNTCKYGDNFIYHKILPQQGIVGVSQLPNIEITRAEAKFAKTMNSSDEHKSGTKFYWQLQDLEFNSFEISHFRLLGDDRKLPYGTSILEKCRRIWKQLLMSEDAMLVYRITRAPERRVYKVYVGNMDDKDIDPYVDKIANSFKRTNVVNSQNGNNDTRMNPMAVDQDFFIPCRDPNLPMPIETLPGASNLSEIADIEYIQKKLLAALRIPKTFLGFEEAMGDGKNLAILDIRFARAVHRVQKALIQELNKIAIIHLYLKGYQDDLSNFSLSLTSPSTQADMLKIQNWQTKVQLYRDAVSDAGNGFAAMSMTKAKKEILGMSDDEIKLDVQRQVIERAANEEMKVLGETIKQTGVFKDIYKVYKINPDNLQTAPVADQQDAGGGGGFGGGGGVGQDFTTPLPGEEEVPVDGVEGDVAAVEPGQQPDASLDQAAQDAGVPLEDENNNDDGLSESFLGSLMGGGSMKNTKNPLDKLSKETQRLNEGIMNSIREIDKILKK